MNWSTIAVVAVVLLSATAVIAIVVPLGTRFFARLGSVVDRWRPTPSDQARPGHERLGLGIMFVTTPIAALLWYDLGPALAALPGADMSNIDLQTILALLLVMVLVPLAGVWALLSWKNVRLEFSGDKVRRTTMLGRQGDWENVTSASMRRSSRGPSTIYIDLKDRWFRVDTGWTNIRDVYESLARAGVPIEPWRDSVQKK